MGARRRGVAVCMAKVAPDLVVVVRQHRHPLIVKLDSQIGWLGGVSRRKRGAARMSAKVALQWPADVLEQALVNVATKGRSCSMPAHSRHLPVSVVWIERREVYLKMP